MLFKTVHTHTYFHLFLDKTSILRVVLPKTLDFLNCDFQFVLIELILFVIVWFKSTLGCVWIEDIDCVAV